MRNFKGYSLIEILFTLFVVALLTVLSIASFRYLITNNEQQVIMDELRTAVQYAKIQTVTKGEPLYLRPLPGQTNWAYGFGLYARNAELLYQWNWEHPQWQIYWKGTNLQDQIQFSPNPGKAISNGKFTLSNNMTKEQFVIVLNRLGRVRIA